MRQIVYRIILSVIITENTCTITHFDEKLKVVSAIVVI